MKSFLKSRTIQATILSVIGTIFVTGLVLTFPYWNPFSRLSETAIYYFAPDFNLSLNSAILAPANCWVNSFSSNRPDAFRCQTDQHEIFDPCFTMGAIGSMVVCPSSPYGDNKYFTVDHNNLPRNLDSSTTTANQYPWFIKLEDNTECKFMTGATLGIADMRLDYGCGQGKYTGILLPIIKDAKLQGIGCYIGTKIASCKLKEVWY